VRQASLALFGPPQPWQTQIYRRRLAFRMIETEARYFRPDFAEWLERNYRVWEAFEREANAVWNGGRRHYSARTIGEYLRHESQTREAPNCLQLKLNDHWWPDLARLYMLMHPDRDGFFERRAGPMTRRAA
jgi:hypothetical protein